MNITSKSLFVFRMRKACDIARQKGAIFNEAVVFAQAALESAWGRSALASEARNILGIKVGSSWRGPAITLPTGEYVDGKWTVTTERFRKYPSWNECIVDYSKILQRCVWYHDALKNIDDAEKFLEGLLPRKGEPGWATDPRYDDKIRRIAQEIERLGGPAWR